MKNLLLILLLCFASVAAGYSFTRVEIDEIEITYSEAKEMGVSIVTDTDKDRLDLTIYVPKTFNKKKYAGAYVCLYASRKKITCYSPIDGSEHNEIGEELDRIEIEFSYNYEIINAFEISLHYGVLDTSYEFRVEHSDL